MKIDSHHHLWRYSAQEYPWITDTLSPLRRDFTAREFQAAMSSAGYEGSVVVQARQTVEETRWLLGEAERWPFLKGVVGWIDLRSPELETLLQEFLPNPKLVGFRHVVHDEPDDFLKRPEVRRGLGVLRDHGLAFDLLVFPRHLPMVMALAAEFPDLTLVIDHLGKPMTPGTDRKAWKEHLSALAACPRISVKLSGLCSETYPARWDAQSIEFFLDTAFASFGSARLLAASNWPVSNLAGSYGWTMGIIESYLETLDARASALVLGENAAAVYHLGAVSA